jgi:transposase
MPSVSELTRFLVPDKLEILTVKRFKRGYLWELRKKRTDGEACPKCGVLSQTRAGRCKTKVRDESFRGVSIWLQIQKHRYLCKECKKTFTETIEGIWPKRRTTQRFRKNLAQMCHNFSNMKSVQSVEKVSSGLLYKVFYEQLESKLNERRGISWPEILGIDEHFFSRAKGYTEFTTVFTDLKKRKLFDACEGKSTKSIIEQIKDIPGREKVKIVVMDLSSGYRSLARMLFPNAEIVADKFHVLRLITPSLIKAGKQIYGHRQELWLKRLILKNRHKLDYFQRSDLDRYLNQHPKLDELYRWKERLHLLYRTKGIMRAADALHKLIEEMKKSNLEEILRLSRTLTRWRKEILLYFDTGLTNAFTESMNNIAKLVQKRGYGYKSFKNYRLRLLSACLAWRS